MLLENVVEKHVLVFADGQNSAMLLLEPTGKLFQRRWQTPRTETPSGVVFVAGRELLERERPLVLAMADKLAPCHLFLRLSSNAISCAHASVVRWEEMELHAQHVSLSFFVSVLSSHVWLAMLASLPPKCGESDAATAPRPISFSHSTARRGRTRDPTTPP